MLSSLALLSRVENHLRYEYYLCPIRSSSYPHLPSLFHPLPCPASPRGGPGCGGAWLGRPLCCRRTAQTGTEAEMSDG